MQEQIHENAAGAESDELLLVRRAAGNDRRSFEQLMRRYNQRLFRLAFSLMGEASEAEDVLQESYVRAFHKLTSFTGRASLGVWLARIVRNEAIDRLRARRARNSAFTLEADLPQGDERLSSAIEQAQGDTLQFSPDIDVERADVRVALEQAIAALPAQFRSVFMLREVEGLSLKETAAYLGVPVATVKTRDHRARLLLRKKLRDQIDAAMQNVFGFLGARCDHLVERVLARLQQ